MNRRCTGIRFAWPTSYFTATENSLQSASALLPSKLVPPIHL
jgi:hypothetical protein